MLTLTQRIASTPVMMRTGRMDAYKCRVSHNELRFLHADNTTLALAYWPYNQRLETMTWTMERSSTIEHGDKVG